MVRINPQARGEGFKEIFFPYLVSVLPFGLLLFPLQGKIVNSPFLVLRLEALMGLGAFITALGIATLGKSYGISAAFRKPVTSGIYRFLRHPIYLGEFIAYLGVTIFRFQWLSLAVYLLFVALQITRAKIEEAKLAKNSPEYREYLKKTPF